MFITSIVLDGFKSFAYRVQITGFDQEFNALTGSNGTGKTNMIDAICFVLGIINIKIVRADRFEELIFMNGTAGVTKATVSITFDNRDKSQSPIGYKKYHDITVTRQVLLDGQNEYLINGIKVQDWKVRKLFCSVHLNVNSPHIIFLMMEGQSDKVLNLQPLEMLSMLEEASGMLGPGGYGAELKKAQELNAKKDATLERLKDKITEDISPKMALLEGEKSQLAEYRLVVKELKNLTKLQAARAETQHTLMSDELCTKVMLVKATRAGSSRQAGQAGQAGQAQVAGNANRGELAAGQLEFVAGSSGREGGSEALQHRLVASGASGAWIRSELGGTELAHATSSLRAPERQVPSTSAQHPEVQRNS